MNKLKSLIKSKGLTHYQVGKAMKPGIKEQSQRMYINDLVTGRRILEVKDAVKLAKMLNCEIKEMI